MKSLIQLFLAVLFCMAYSGVSHAGLYTDDLSRCLVESTTPNDRVDLARWIFSVMLLHPGVSDMAATTTPQRDEINRRTARHFERLLVDDCRTQAKNAMQYEGGNAMQNSFEVLGKVAMQELMNQPEVMEGIRAFAKFLDMEKFKSLAPENK